MSTTELFVEILVIGVGAGIWLTVLVLSLFGRSIASLDQLVSIPALLPIIAIIYVLGILTDRVSDILFDRLFVAAIRRKHYSEVKQEFDDRRTILVYSERLSQLLEYGRSKLRIVRGWALNFLLLLISLNLFLATQIMDNPLRTRISFFGNTLLLLLSFLCWYAWRSLIDTEYRKIKEQSEFLRSIGLAKTPKKSRSSKSD